MATTDREDLLTTRTMTEDDNGDTRRRPPIEDSIEQRRPHQCVLDIFSSVNKQNGNRAATEKPQTLQTSTQPTMTLGVLIPLSFPAQPLTTCFPSFTPQLPCFLLVDGFAGCFDDLAIPGIGGDGRIYLRLALHGRRALRTRGEQAFHRVAI